MGTPVAVSHHPGRIRRGQHPEAARLLAEIEASLKVKTRRLRPSRRRQRRAWHHGCRGGRRAFAFLGRATSPSRLRMSVRMSRWRSSAAARRLGCWLSRCGLSAPSRPARIGSGRRTLAAGQSSSRRREAGRNGAKRGVKWTGSGADAVPDQASNGRSPGPRRAVLSGRALRRVREARGCGRSRPGRAAAERPGGGTERVAEWRTGERRRLRASQLGRPPERVSVAGVVVLELRWTRAGRNRGR